MSLNFTTTVKARMKTLQMKPIDLARKTGYSAQYISELLSGQKRWNETTMSKVCEILDIKVRFVFDDQTVRQSTA